MTKNPPLSRPRRYHWAASQIAAAPSDRLLEIGCGSGITTEIICERLTTGAITAIDRSPGMIRIARERNSSYIASGLATIEAADFASAHFTRQAFDKIFAINVSLFWLGDPAAMMRRAAKFLAAQGKLVIIFERPAAVAGGIADRIRSHLTRAGLTLTAQAHEDTLVCLTASVSDV